MLYLNNNFTYTDEPYRSSIYSIFFINTIFFNQNKPLLITINKEHLVLNKTNTNDVANDLVSCVLTYDFLCLPKSQKW